MIFRRILSKENPQSDDLLKINDFGPAREDFLKSIKTNLVKLAASEIQFHNCGSDFNQKAIDYCKNLVDIFPKEYLFWLALGDCWLDLPVDKFVENVSEPLEAFKNVVLLNPTCHDGWYGLGMVNQYIGSFNEAKNCFEKANEICPQDVSSRMRLWLLEKEGFLKTDHYEKLQCPENVIKEFNFNESLSLNELSELTKKSAVIIRNFFKNVEFSKIRTLLVPLARDWNFKENNASNTSIAFNEIQTDIKDLIEEKLISQIMEDLHGLVSIWRNKGWEPFPNPAKWIQFYENDAHLNSRATPYHQDHPINSQKSDWTTFWVPITPSGINISSTLEVLDAYLSKPIDALEHKIGRINPIPIDLIDEFFKDAMIPINANPGDLVVFGRSMLHRTLNDPSMKFERLSLDFRYMTGPSRFGKFF